jgi:DNA-binding HxlR family transcriptional regulator
MKTYGQYCPVARALEVVGDRWSLLIVRDLLLAKRGFNELERGLPGVSRSLLAQRLRLLERGGVLARELGSDGRARAYALTDSGRELAPLIDAARVWGGRWALKDPRPGELDPAWVLTSMLRRRRAEALPPRRVVVEFRVRGGRRPIVWLVLDGTANSEVCLKDPGFPADLVVAAEARALSRVWLGRLPREQAERRGLLRIEGRRELARAFPAWFDWPSVPAPAVPVAAAAAPGNVSPRSARRGS